MGKSGARLSSPARTAGMDTSVTPGSGEQNDKLDDAFRFIAAHPYVRKIGRRGITKNEGKRKELCSLCGKRPEGKGTPEFLIGLCVARRVQFEPPYAL